MYKEGDIVCFRYTGSTAEILKDHKDGSYSVWLEEDDCDSIAFADDIVLKKDFKKTEQSEQQKLLEKKPKGLSTEELFYGKDKSFDKTPESLNSRKAGLSDPSLHESKENSFSVQEIKPTKPTQTGCHLAFHQTTPVNYTIYLVNDTPVSFSFEFKLFLHKKLEHGFNRLIPSNTFFAVGGFLHEQFNDSPHIEFKCPKFNFVKNIKLKYKKFAGTHKSVPLMGISTYSYLIFKSLDPFTEKNKTIKKYTLEHKNEQDELIEPINDLYRSFDLLDIASFEPELDLHAEKLVNDTSKFTSIELYEIQLKILDTFITKAINIDMREVFVIHGLGKGKLQKGVDDYLRFHGDVKSYKNEFHEKYGFGATRVVFRK